jgi:hypothetical protein
MGEKLPFPTVKRATLLLLIITMRVLIVILKSNPLYRLPGSCNQTGNCNIKVMMMVLSDRHLKELLLRLYPPNRCSSMFLWSQQKVISKHLYSTLRLSSCFIMVLSL